jgi:hypothetical protein
MDEVAGRRRRRGRAAARRFEKVVHDPVARALRSRRRLSVPVRTARLQSEGSNDGGSARQRGWVWWRGVTILSCPCGAVKT